MKELCPFPLASDANPEHDLLESMPEEDQAALFPIIKMAFPIQEWGRVQSFCPSQVPLNMQMDYQQRSLLSKEVHGNPDDSPRMDKAMCASHVDHEVKGGQYTMAQSLVVPPFMFPHTVTQVSERVTPEHGFTLADGRLLLSLSAACSQPRIPTVECMLDCNSSEYSWLQQQEALLCATFPCGDHVWKRVPAENALDLNNSASCRFAESNKAQGVSDSEATRRQGELKQSLVIADKRKPASTRYQECDLKADRAQPNHVMTEDVESSKENKMSCSGSQLEGRLVEDLQKLTGSHVSAATNEPLMIERCHRSNGKQWRCAKNATPGTLYCEIHHKYRSKRNLKKTISPDKLCFLEQKRAAFLKEKEANVGRCHRTDGNLWQCSKLATPGSSYCENHRNRRKKPKMQLKATSFALKNNKAVAEREHATPLRVGNQLDETSICRSIQSSGLMQLCNLIARGRDLEMKMCGDGGEKYCGSFIVKHEDDPGRKVIQNVQIEDTVGGLVSVTDRQEQDRVELLFSDIPTPERRKGVHGQLVEKASLGSVACHASGARLGVAEPQSDKEGGFVLCRRNDGKQWWCSQPSEPSSVYCKHHQPKTKATKTKQAKGQKQKMTANRGTRSSNRDAKDQVADIIDDCFTGIVCHKEQLQEHLSSTISQEVFAMKKCQRRDGKSWQCSKDAKEGHNYCLHHLEYLSKRKACFLHDNEESSKVVSAAQVTAAIPTITNQGLSARELVQIHSSANSPADSFNQLCSHEDSGTVLRESDENLDSSLGDPLNASCNFKHGNFTHALEVSTILEELSSVDDNIQKQEVCAPLDHPLPELNLSRGISRQEKCTYFDSSSQHQQHSVRGASILYSQNQESCVTHSTCAETRCNEGSCKEEKEVRSLHESKQVSSAMSQDTFSLKQCQRKDGKGWQCSKSAKQGQNYCSYHLVYLKNRRHASKSNRKTNIHITSQNRRPIYTGDGPPLSVTCSVPQAAMAMRKLSKTGTLSSEDIQSSLADTVEALCNQSHS